jgi:pimeloyl-ACP methyl ester carboxylesterase
MEHKRKGLALAQERAHAAQVVWMEDTIHDVPLQRPEELARVIDEFLLGLA